VFALFGSEEIGGLARVFSGTPAGPSREFVANLEFEMIGRPDFAVAAHTLWLTGYERSNLGAELAAHGARLVATRILNSTSFNVPIIMSWPGRESSRTQFSSTAC